LRTWGAAMLRPYMIEVDGKIVARRCGRAEQAPPLQRQKHDAKD
jgi:hypothetical protein